MVARKLRGNANRTLSLHRYRHSQIITSPYGKQKGVRASISLDSDKQYNDLYLVQNWLILLININCQHTLTLNQQLTANSDVKC